MRSDFDTPDLGHNTGRGHFSGNPQQELESRAGVQPIDELLNERDILIDRVADLRAKYGSFGTFDHARKIELARLKALIRAQATRDKIKITNDQLDDEAHSHIDYIEFITTATKERAQWVRTEAQIEAIDAKLYRGQALIRFASSEMRT